MPYNYNNNNNNTNGLPSPAPSDEQDAWVSFDNEGTTNSYFDTTDKMNIPTRKPKRTTTTNTTTKYQPRKTTTTTTTQQQRQHQQQQRMHQQLQQHQRRTTTTQQQLKRQQQQRMTTTTQQLQQLQQQRRTATTSTQQRRQQPRRSDTPPPPPPPAASHYYSSGHQEAVECIYGSPKTPHTNGRSIPTRAIYMNSPITSANTPPRRQQQEEACSPNGSIGTMNSSSIGTSKEESFQDDDDDDDDEIWVPNKQKKNRASGCFFSAKCWAMTACGVLTVLVFFILSLTIGTLLRGEALTLSNIFFGEPHVTLSPTASMVPSQSPTDAPSVVPPLPSNVTVAAYYYPWHGNDFHGRQYLREQLNMEPALGEYDDTLSTTIAQHLYWSRYSNIRVWITSWWGAGRREDDTILNRILPHKDLNDHQIALLYETTGRIKKSENYTTQRIMGDIEYMCEFYFEHPNYYRIDGRPVLFVYLTRKLEAIGKMEEVILLMKSTADHWGYDLYLIGDHVWQQAPPGQGEVFRPFYYLDALTNYDVYGSMTGKRGMYAGYEAVTQYYQSQKEWKGQAKAQSRDCGFIPAVSPGFNDRGVRLEADHLPLSRKIAPNAIFGSLFEESLRQAIPLVDHQVNNLLIVNSFNEWHEDTQIEPAVVKKKNDGDSSYTDFNPNEFDYTQGIEYEGYGERYLTILREMTTFSKDTTEEGILWGAGSSTNMERSVP